MTTSIISLIMDIAKHCKKHNIIIRTAESCTGGALASYLTHLPGSSQFFDRGIVAYSNNAKHKLLNIPKYILDRYGAVSNETAILMAENLLSPTDQQILALAVTGILGPGSDNTNKPVGLVHIAACYNGKTEVKQYNLSGDRYTIKEKVLLEALTLGLKTLKHK